MYIYIHIFELHALCVYVWNMTCIKRCICTIACLRYFTCITCHVYKPEMWYCRYCSPGEPMDSC